MIRIIEVLLIELKYDRGYLCKLYYIFSFKTKQYKNDKNIV